jgi:hypothetical protein
LVGEQESFSNQQFGLRSYPNPFSTSVNFEYWLEKPQTVTITFYNQFGKKVDMIEEKQQGGSNQLQWRPENLNSGAYFYRLQAGKSVSNGKLLLMK